MFEKRKPISEQVIVITGATSGIGLATARLAAKKGAKVVLASRNRPDLDVAVKKIVESGGVAIAVPTDVAKETDLEALRKKAVEAFGRIDTWVNNAGTSIYGKLVDLDIHEERKLFEVNYWGIRNGSRIALPELTKTKGTLINFGSEVSARSIPLQGVYSATKHAVKAYTDALRMELEKDEVPVAVCLVRPTAIATPFPEHAVNRLARGAPSLPSPRYHPDAVAAAIVDCAEHPKRDVFVGSSAKLFSILEAIAPRFTDLLIEKKLFKQQTEGNVETHHEENENLFHPSKEEGKVLGKQKGKVRRESVYAVAARKGRKAAQSSRLSADRH